MRQSWYSIKALAADQPAQIDILDEIGYWGVTAGDFIAELRAITADQIDLGINSPGGSLMDALAIYNALRHHPATIHVRVLGMAASAASVVAMAGDSIVMPENAHMMLHRVSNLAFGNAAELRDMADLLDKFDASLVSTYSARSGQTPDAVRQMMADTTWMSAAEAVALGFADSLEPAIQATALFDLDNLPDSVRAAFATVHPEIKPVPADASNTLPARIEALAKAVGLEAYAADLALDATLIDDESAAAAIADAREIFDLCAIAKLPARAAEFISTRTTLPQARAALLEARAATDRSLHVDGHPPASGTPPAPAPVAAVKTAEIWARRNQSR